MVSLSGARSRKRRIQTRRSYGDAAFLYSETKTNFRSPNMHFRLDSGLGKFGRAHQVFVDAAGGHASFANGPDDE
jgi:hypothetical protein